MPCFVVNLHTTWNEAGSAKFETIAYNKQILLSLIVFKNHKYFINKVNYSKREKQSATHATRVRSHVF